MTRVFGFLFFLMILFTIACSSSKNAEAKTSHIIVELVDGIDGRYIKKTYDYAHIDIIKPISRSHNDWMFVITCNDKEKTKLLESMKKDKKIISVRDSTPDMEPQQGSIMQGKKVKPSAKQ